jgi:CheY-like chemotaxis protein
VTEPVVLVVEDDLSMRKFVSDALSNRGHSVASVATGEEALQALSRMPQPDLIVLTSVFRGLTASLS